MCVQATFEVQRAFQSVIHMVREGGQLALYWKGHVPEGVTTTPLASHISSNTTLLTKVRNEFSQFMTCKYHEGY